MQKKKKRQARQKYKKLNKQTDKWEGFSMPRYLQKQIIIENSPPASILP